MTTQKNQIIIFDTTLRDEEQSLETTLSTDDKLIIAQQLATLGVDVIEAGFRYAKAGAKIADRIGVEGGPIMCALVRATREEIKAAFSGLKLAVHPRIHTRKSISASTHV